MASLCSSNFTVRSSCFLLNFISLQKGVIVKLYRRFIMDGHSKLVEPNNVLKWTTTVSRKSNLSHRGIAKTDQNTSYMSKLSFHEINNLFDEAVQAGDEGKTINLMEECLIYNKCPSAFHIIKVLSLCAQRGKISLIIELQKFCGQHQSKLLETQSDFKCFLAEATFFKGNILEALKLFEEVYLSNWYMRRRIRLTVRLLIADVVKKQSHAVLLNFITFSKYLAQNHGDFYLLLFIWQTCFLSEWFADQNVAFELIENNEKILQAVLDKIQHVVIISLCDHKTDNVYRLLQVLLKNKMYLQYNSVLVALLDYEVRQGNVRNCMEIIKWSMENRTVISSTLLVKFVSLIEPQNGRTSRKVEFNFEKIKDYTF